jgi:hypothetical protein
MRRVTAPDGREWKVGRQWLPARARIQRGRRDDGHDGGAGTGDDSGDGGDGFLDTMGDFFGLDDAGAGILVGFAALALGALVVVVVFPVIALTVELIVLLALFLAGIVGRVVFRRPWHVLAQTDDAAYRWPVRGWRASRERVDAVADGLTRGALPPDAEAFEP